MGTTFVLAAGDEPLEVVLAGVEAGQEQPGAPRDQPFTLTFTAPAGTLLEQATYALDHPVLGRVALFLVPRQPDADGLARYEADFN
jgi:hypothetical protein